MELQEFEKVKYSQENYIHQFLFLSFRRVLNVICSFLGNSYFIDLPMKMEPIVSSETSAVRTQTPGNYPKRSKLNIHQLQLKLQNQVCHNEREFRVS